MLHALLRRKLHPSIPEPDRLEDALTSTLLGALVWLDAWDVLCDWLGLEQATDFSENAYWFWPRLAYAEPDVVLRLGRNLVVIEAKFSSGRHDGAPILDDETSTSDQIVRQYNSIFHDRSVRLPYTPLLETAISRCRCVQVMAVDSRRIRRARREYHESASKLPATAEFRLVTWQKLYSRIATLGRTRTWVSDLLSYMESIGLDSYNGIGHGLVNDASVTNMLGWKAPQRIQCGLRRTVAAMYPIRITSLLLWRQVSCESSGSDAHDRVRWFASAQNALDVIKWGGTHGDRAQRGAS
jgi:hypothetical protein